MSFNLEDRLILSSCGKQDSPELFNLQGIFVLSSQELAGSWLVRQVEREMNIIILSSLLCLLSFGT